MEFFGFGKKQLFIILKMANCILCDSKLSFSNKPLVGLGKLQDGNELCSKCVTELVNGTKGPFKFKNMTTSEVKEALVETRKAKEVGMQRLNEIKEQIKRANPDSSSLIFTMKEVEELPAILSNQESILAIVRGNYEKSSGILVATENRLIFIDKGVIYGLKTEDFAYDKITSIQFETEILSGKLIIMASGNKAQIESVFNNKVKPFADFVRERIKTLDRKENEQNFDLVEQLTKLASLRDKGILTEEEFQKQKAKLLA